MINLADPSTDVKEVFEQFIKSYCNMHKWKVGEALPGWCQVHGHFYVKDVAWWLYPDEVSKAIKTAKQLVLVWRKAGFIRKSKVSASFLFGG